jgi:catechol 2,3-dioxygenase-like lactoylglutathione lyase family enzyme
MSTGIFAGIPVRSRQQSLDWYQRLLGGEPAFFPNDAEAVWQLAEDRYVYLVEDARRVGGAVLMIWYDDPVAVVAGISERGIDHDEIEQHDDVRKYVFHDADGNEIGIGGEVRSAPGTVGP